MRILKCPVCGQEKEINGCSDVPLCPICNNPMVFDREVEDEKT